MRQVIELTEKDVISIIAREFNANPENVGIEYFRNNTDGIFAGGDFIEVKIKKEMDV